MSTYLTPLDRIQADAVEAAKAPSVWLDAHQEDVVLLVKEKGTSTVAALCGLSVGTLRLWLKRRKLYEAAGIKPRRPEKKPDPAPAVAPKRRYRTKRDPVSISRVELPGRGPRLAVIEIRLILGKEET